MSKKIANAVGYGFGACCKYYFLFAIPQVWFWLPALAIEKFIRGNK